MFLCTIHAIWSSDHDVYFNKIEIEIEIEQDLFIRPNTNLAVEIVYASSPTSTD